MSNEPRKTLSDGTQIYPEHRNIIKEGPRKLGTPISELSGRPGEKGYSEFCRIARSWGFD